MRMRFQQTRLDWPYFFKMVPALLGYVVVVVAVAPVAIDRLGSLADGSMLIIAPTFSPEFVCVKSGEDGEPALACNIEACLSDGSANMR